MERHGEAWRGMERQKEAKKKKNRKVVREREAGKKIETGRQKKKNNIGESKEKT